MSLLSLITVAFALAIEANGVTTTYSCEQITPIEDNWSNVPGVCYAQLVHVPRSVTPGRCIYQQIVTFQSDCLYDQSNCPPPAGVVFYHSDLNGETQVRTTFSWNQIKWDSASSIAQYDSGSMYHSSVIASTSDGYVIVSCSMNDDDRDDDRCITNVYLCTYTRNPSADAINQLKRLTETAGIDTSNFVSVDQNKCQDAKPTPRPRRSCS